MSQLVHRGRQSVGALAGVCVAIILIFMQMGFSNALYDSAVNLFRSMDGEIFITSPYYTSMVFSPPWFPSHALTLARGLEGVEDARPLYAFSGLLRSPRTGSIGAWILAFDIDRPAIRLQGLSTSLDILRIPDTALLDRKSRYDFEYPRRALEAGEYPEMPVHQPGATLAPVLKLRGMFTLGPTFTMDGLLVTSDLNFNRALHIPLDRVSVGAVLLKPGADARQVATELNKALAGTAKASLRDDFITAEQGFYARRTPIGVIFKLGLLVGVVVGVVFISQVLHGIIDANLKEYAVLVAMGYSSRFFTLIVLEIATAIAVLTFIPSLAISAGLYQVATQATHLPLNLSFGEVAGILGLVLLMGCVAALFAMRRVRLANPLDLFS